MITGKHIPPPGQLRKATFGDTSNAGAPDARCSSQHLAGPVKLSIAKGFAHFLNNDPGADIMLICSQSNAVAGPTDRQQKKCKGSCHCLSTIEPSLSQEVEISTCSNLPKQAAKDNPESFVSSLTTDFTARRDHWRMDTWRRQSIGLSLHILDLLDLVYAGVQT
jgi:hypothetical protein